jgi:hypothetical protein
VADDARGDVSVRAVVPAHLAFTSARGGFGGAVGWLVEALELAGADRDLIGAVHQEARRHRVPDAGRFDQAWATRSGRTPGWLAVDPALQGSFERWMTTATYEEERDYLAAHPGLLAADADLAAAEALLHVSEASRTGSCRACRRASTC